jgi:hypothetical protein
MKYAWNDKIQISALYTLPEKEIDNWYAFSQVLPDVSVGFSFEQEQLLRAEGRLVVKTLEHVPAGDGDDDCTIQTVWFDDKPFAILRRNGQHGTARSVTDPAVLCEAMMYLVKRAAELLEADDFEDYQDPDEVFPVDEIFVGLLEEKFVIPEVLPPDDDRVKRSVIHYDLDGSDTEIIMSQTESPPTLLRRGKAFIRYERPLTDEEVVECTRLFQADSPYMQKGHIHGFLYRYIARPENYQDAVGF